MMAAASVILDGSVLEGGGQLLRNAIAFSTLLSRPITVHNIRHNRKPPGLKFQHAAGIQLAAEISSAQLTGAEIGSSSIEYISGPIRTSKTYIADPKTAGSTTLLLQVSLPCLLFSPPHDGPPPAPSELILRGGTNATQAPQIDHSKHIFLPFLRQRFGLDVRMNVHRRGYYPRGGGEIHVSVPPVPGPLSPVTLTERGALKSIMGRAYVAGLPRRLAEQIRSAAYTKLTDSGVDPNMIDITAVRERNQDVVGSGSGLVLWAETENGCRIGGSAIGSKGKDMSVVGEAAAEGLLRDLQHGGCVDEYLQDQIIIYLALAAGRSTIRTGPVTLHTRTAIWVAEQLTDAKFDIKEDEDGQTVLLSCDGIGYTASAHGSGTSG